MNYNRLPKKIREKIEYLFNGDKESVITAFRISGDFKLMDKSPNNSYYSYYVSIENMHFMISIDFTQRYISMHNYERDLFSKRF